MLSFTSFTQLFPTLCNPLGCSTPGFPVLHQLPELAKTRVHRVSHPTISYSIVCSLLLLPSIFPSVRVFFDDSVLRFRWSKYWSFSFNICPSSEYSELISFRMDWLDLLVVQGALRSSPTPQFKSINSLVLSFLYSPTLTSVHDYWKNHSFV